MSDRTLGPRARCAAEERRGALPSRRHSRRRAARLGISGAARRSRRRAIYGGTRALLKSLAFLLVPLYAHFLTPSEFGLLELVLATVALVDVLIAACMDGVFARFYFDRDDPPGDGR